MDIKKEAKRILEEAQETCGICYQCQRFNTRGYDEVPDEDLILLQSGWCSSWQRETQACDFCSRFLRR